MNNKRQLLASTSDVYSGGKMLKMTKVHLARSDNGP